MNYNLERFREAIGAPTFIPVSCEIVGSGLKILGRNGDEVSIKRFHINGEINPMIGKILIDEIIENYEL